MSAGHCVHKWWNPFIGMSWHDAVIVPLPGPVPRVPHLSFSIVNGSWLGSLPSGPPGLPPGPGPTVGGGGAALMGRGTDAGYIVPHIPLPPLNTLLPLVILFGESKIMFGSSSVKIPCRNLLFQDSVEDLGCVALPVGIPLGIDFDCNEIVPVPLDLAIAPNTIHVGMSPMDWLAAAIDIGIELALGAIFHFGGKAVKKAGRARKAAKRAAAEAGEEAGERARKRAARELRQEIEAEAKQAAKAAKPFKKTAAAREAADRVRARWQREAADGSRDAVTQRAQQQARERAAREARTAARQRAEQEAREAAEREGREAYSDTFKRSYRQAYDETYEAAYEQSFDEARERGLREARDQAGSRFDRVVADARRDALDEFGEKAFSKQRWGDLVFSGTEELIKEAGVEPWMSSLSKFPQGEDYYVGKWGSWFDDLEEPERTPEFGGQPSASQDWWEGSTSAAATASAPAGPWWGGITDLSATGTPLPYDNWWS
jgi:hypothetical protein